MSEATAVKRRRAGRQRIRADALVLHYDLYPRNHLDSTNTQRILEAFEAGAELPAVVADRDSLRVIDGFHRVTAAKRLDSDAEIVVELRDYPDERAMLLDAIQRNATHGQAISPYDRGRILLLAETHKITVEEVAAVLRVPLARLEQIRDTRQALRSDGKTKVMVKRSLRHLAGSTLTEEQEQANRKASGWPPAFHAEQIVMLIESGSVDWSDERLKVALSRLREAICDLSFPE